MREKGLVGGKVMLTEKRQKEILKLLGEKGSVTVQELTEKLNASESTIRRDLTLLHQKGELVKVFGGAVQTESRINIREEKVALRKELKKEEKIRIARYAASLVEPDDFVYLRRGRLYHRCSRRRSTNGTFPWKTSDRMPGFRWNR